MGDRRATAANEKAARRREILAATGELLGGWSYDDLTMDRIADRVGLAKGTLYLYFRTKEALFLELYEERLGSWYGELESLAAQGSTSVTPDSAARIIAATLASRPILVRSLRLFCSNIGRHADLETVRAFRRRQAQRISTVASALAARIEGLSEGSARRFLVRLEIVAGGLSLATDLTAATGRASLDADFEIFRIDFEEELREILAALMR